MKTVLIVIHVILALALIIAVLMQHGKQQGLSGAIAGGAETFFGKNKGRTIDAMLKKVTSVVAALFIVCSVALAFVATNEGKVDVTEENAQNAVTDVTNGGAAKDGNIVDDNGNVILDAETLEKAVQESETKTAE